ncbi:M48 metallopeptidase family protein [Kribbia dieselivorans]|uniref:M48 metallopeptidase family protein n=1 Tax=Kribbia dieselivorans TaxID=331526 RepID=UPI000837E767|nr:M48 family metallopeptidase [Kribbia dieselivorans]
MPGETTSDQQVEIRRSRRRRRTVSAYRDGDRTVVLIPAGHSAAQERAWVDGMLAKLAAKEKKRRPSDADLVERAAHLSATYLGGLAKPTQVRWVTNQRSRWGSCTPLEGTIRLSSRLQGMPTYVTDYVLLHELAHLLVAGHGDDFWALLAGYPRLERARGFLAGVTHAEHSGSEDPDTASHVD